MNVHQAREATRHMQSHTAWANGFDGYTTAEAVEWGVQTVLDFMVGDLTVEEDVAPFCDETCTHI